MGRDTVTEQLTMRTIQHFVLLCTVLLVQPLGAQIVVLSGPADQAVVYGQDVFLNCSVLDLSTGTSAGLTISWTFNNASLPQHMSMFSNGTLLVPKVAEKDLGNYSCRVNNESGNTMWQSQNAWIFHAFIKMFELSPSPVYAVEDELVSFDCITGESAPPPEVFWERNGVKFTRGEQFSATYGGYGSNSLIVQYTMKLMLRAKQNLDGTFSCVARNHVLQIDVRSLSVRLQTAELQTAPYILEEGFEPVVIAPVNQPMLLDCPIAGKPQADITWFKNGRALAGLSGMYILMNGSLQFLQTAVTDEGLYFCEGRNPLGSARSPNISVTIARIEVDFEAEPEDVYAIAGLPVTLKCAPPFSIPTVTVTWYKDNALLVPRTGNQAVQVVKTVEGNWDVTFKSIQKIDEGTYFCVATNTYAVPQSRTSRSASIRVGGAPIFVEPPVGLTVQKGKLAELTCYVQGDPFPEVTWLYENSVVTASETVSFRQGKQELWIGNVDKGNEGTYTCRAVNRYGSIQTTVYVKVLVPPVVLEPVGHTVASFGDSVIIPCGIYSDPEPTVVWFKGSVGLTFGGRFTKLHDGLYITSVQLEDSGAYTCQASNTAGTAENTGSLEVLVKPVFIDEPRDVVVNVGRNVTLNCSAKGHPDPELKWTFNDTDLFPPGTLITLDKHRVLLLDVGWMHVGKYSCIAENEEGKAQASSYVRIQVPAKIVEVEGVPLLFKGENLKLTCHVTGIPAPSIEWQLNSQPVVESVNGRISFPEPGVLSVQYVTSQDAGTYTCKVMNGAGVSQKDMEVYIIDEPSPPALLSAQTVSSSMVRLTWSAVQQQPQVPVDIINIFIRRKLDNTAPNLVTQLAAIKTEYVVTDLLPATDYIFVISAQNDAGTSNLSNSLAAKTFDAGPSAPRNLAAIQVNAYNITIGWEIPETKNGDIKKYQLRFGESGGPAMSDVLVSSDNTPYHSFVINTRPYTRYVVEVRAATMEGDQLLWGNWTSTLQVKTLEAAPTGPAREVKAVALTTDTVQVFWEAVSQSEQNGPIRRYYARYWLLGNSSSFLGEEIVDSLNLQVNLSGLDPWTWYIIKVIPENVVGPGEASVPINVRTLPSAPSGAPRNVSVTALTASSLLVSWQPPSLRDWNSDLTGFLIEYWLKNNVSTKTIVSLGLQKLEATISDLQPYSYYGVHVAAFTELVTQGFGPFSQNASVRTLESEPGPVAKLWYSATSSTLQLSWQPPEITNGIIMEYSVRYFLVGAASASFVQKPLLADHIQILLNSSVVKNSVFKSFSRPLSVPTLKPLVEFCDIILRNNTLYKVYENSTDILDLKSAVVTENISDYGLVDWMSRENLTFGSVCSFLEDFVLEFLASDTGPVIHEEFSFTTNKTTVSIPTLQSNSIYNVSVSARTKAGEGPYIHIQAVTTIEVQTTLVPAQTSTPASTTVTQQSLLQEYKGTNVNLSVVLPVGISGFMLLVLVLVIGGCLCFRRHQSEEKSKVIDMEQEGDGSSMYGQLDRPVAILSPGTALAAEDGTDCVDINDDRIRFHSPRRPHEQDHNRTFMTDQSGHMGESYLGLPARNTVNSNPAYYEESSSSNMETMSVTMAFSSEDNPVQSKTTTLKRTSKMKNVDAAIIARLRNSTLPHASTDRSALLHNELEVVCNERTAL